MNKFFRLVSMFAIAGVTFAYTSCTDYSEDINKVDDRVDNLEGRLTTVEGQVKNLETATTDLKKAQAETDAAVTTLETTLKELQTKHDKDIADLQKAYAAADAALKTEIQGKIDALTKTHNDDVKNINNAIKALQDGVKALQDKADAVEKLLPTLATKNDLQEASQKTAEAIAEVNKTIGALQGDLEIAQKNITALQTKVATLEGDVEGLKTAVANAQKAADAAQTAADKAQDTADKALGEIDALKKALGAYAKEGALEKKIAELEKMDSTFKADKLNIEDFEGELFKLIGDYSKKGVLEAKLTALGGKDTELEGQISDLAQKLTETESALNTKITKLSETVEQYNTALNQRINAVLGIIEGRLSSIAFVPEYYYDGVPAILFETIAYDPLADAKENEVAKNKIDGKQNSVDVNKYTKFTSALAKAQYRLNPRTVGVDCADFSFVGDKADYVVTRATAPAAPVSIEGVTESATGYVTFTVKKNEKLNVTDNSNKNLDIVALKAVLKKGLTDAEAKAEQKPEVYSEYAHVNEIAYSAANLAISDSAKLVKNAAGHEYAKTFDAAKAQDRVYDMPYNSDPFDLKALVATCINTEIKTLGLEAVQNHAKLDLDKYGFTYKFSVAKTPYVVESDETKTDQNTVIECVDAEKGLYKVKAAKGAEFNKEAIGRTPIVRVDLMHNGNIVTRAFIKLLISVEKTYELPTIQGEELNRTLLCEDDPKAFVSTEISEETLRDAIYRALNIDHVSFWNIYAFDKAWVTKNDEASTITAPQLKDGPVYDGKATKKIVWNFTHKEVGVVGEAVSVINGYLTLKNTIDAVSEYPSQITFKFTVNFKRPALEIVHSEKEIFWKDGVLQANVNTPASKTDDSKNCWFNTPIEEQPWYELSVKGLPCNETPAFRIIKLVENGDTLTYKNASQGVRLNEFKGEVSISLDKSNETVKTALNSEKGLQAVVEWYAVGKSGDVYSLHTFMVNFIRPVNLNLPQTLKVKDAVDNGDEINLGIQGLLTDWRDSVIVAPLGMIEKTAEDFYWKKTCSGHAPVVIPGYTKILEPAHYDVVYGDAEAEILTGQKYFEATIQLYKNDKVAEWYDNAPDPSRIYYSSHYKTFVYEVRYGYGYREFKQMPKGELVKVETIVATGRSMNEAIMRAKAQIKDAYYIVDNTHEHYATYGDLDGRTCESNVVEKEAKLTIKYRTIVDIKYVPAVTKEVPAQVIPVECNPMPGPSADAIKEGYTVGCWTWTKYTYPYYDYDLGQYWQFYGPISDIVFDTAKVTTNLADTELPSGASLEQDGYKLKYKNVLSPVLKPYEIYVPVSIKYGWGVLADTLTITVIPQNSVK